jgi:hypothetical protein
MHYFLRKKRNGTCYIIQNICKDFYDRDAFKDLYLNIRIKKFQRYSYSFNFAPKRHIIRIFREILPNTQLQDYTYR